MRRTPFNPHALVPSTPPQTEDTRCPKCDAPVRVFINSDGARTLGDRDPSRDHLDHWSAAHPCIIGAGTEAIVTPNGRIRVGIFLKEGEYTGNAALGYPLHRCPQAPQPSAPEPPPNPKETVEWRRHASLRITKQAKAFAARWGVDFDVTLKPLIAKIGRTAAAERHHIHPDRVVWTKHVPAEVLAWMEERFRVATSQQAARALSDLAARAGYSTLRPEHWGRLPQPAAEGTPAAA